MANHNHRKRGNRQSQNPRPEGSGQSDSPQKQKEPGRYKEHTSRIFQKFVAAPTGVVVRWLDTHNGLVTALATVVIAFLTFFVARLSGGQLAEMRAEQRPILWSASSLGQPQYLAFQGAKTGQIIWSFHPYNYGRGMVINGHARSYIQFGSDAPRQSYKQPTTGQVISPIAPGQDTVSTVISDPGISPEQFNALMQQDHGITVIIVANYTDLAGNTYETGICFSHMSAGLPAYCTDRNYVK